MTPRFDSELPPEAREELLRPRKAKLKSPPHRTITDLNVKEIKRGWIKTSILCAIGFVIIVLLIPRPASTPKPLAPLAAPSPTLSATPVPAPPVNAPAVGLVPVRRAALRLYREWVRRADGSAGWITVDSTCCPVRAPFIIDRVPRALPR